MMRDFGLSWFFPKEHEHGSYIETLRENADLDGKKFRQVLNYYFPNGSFSPRRVLDICAGVAPEEPELVNRFQINEHELISIEKERDFVDLAEQIGRKTVVQGNLSDSNFVRSLEGSFYRAVLMNMR